MFSLWPPVRCLLSNGVKIISFITDFIVIRKILEHLELWEQKPSRDPPKQEPFHENNELLYETFDDGWPQYDEDSIVLN